MLLKAMARARGRKRRQRGVLTWTRSKKGECRATSSNRFDIQRTMNVPTPGVHRATREGNAHFEYEKSSILCQHVFVRTLVHSERKTQLQLAQQHALPLRVVTLTQQQQQPNVTRWWVPVTLDILVPKHRNVEVYGWSVCACTRLPCALRAKASPGSRTATSRAGECTP